MGCYSVDIQSTGRALYNDHCFERVPFLWLDICDDGCGGGKGRKTIINTDDVTHSSNSHLTLIKHTTRRARRGPSHPFLYPSLSHIAIAETAVTTIMSDPIVEKSGFLKIHMTSHSETLVAYARWYGKVIETISGGAN